MTLFPEAHPRYAGSYQMDGQTYLFNIVASSLEDVETKLLTLRPGKVISGIKAREVISVKEPEGKALVRCTVTM